MKKRVITDWSSLPIILDTATVALVFGVRVGTVKQWVYQGRLQSTQIGRQHFFEREYLRLLVANRRGYNE